MADKTGSSGAAGRAPAAGQADSVRNVVLVGHSGAGKTTLVEALLVAHRRDPAGRPGGGRHDGQRLRRGRGAAAALGQPHAGAGAARRRQGQPAGHARLRRLHRRPAGRAAGRRRRAVHRLGRRRHRRPDPDAVGGVRRGRHPARRGDHQARPSARRLRRGARRLPGRVRRLGRSAVPAGDRRPGRRQGPDRPAVRAVLRLLIRQPGGAATPIRTTRTGWPSPQRADRVDHPGERGRVAHGPLPRRRAHRRQGADRGPGEGGRPRQLLPGARGRRPARHRPGRAARDDDRGVPGPAGAPDARGDLAGRQAGERRSAATRRARCSPRWSRRPSDPYVGRISLVRVFSGTLRPDATVHVSGHGRADRGHADHDQDERVGALTLAARQAAAHRVPVRRRGHLRRRQADHAPRPATPCPTRTARC